MAKIFPLDADIMACEIDIPFSKASKNATSELNGRMVAAKKAEKQRAISAIKYSLSLKR